MNHDAPHRLPAALLALDTNVKNEGAGGRIEVDLTPVPPTHDMLVLARLARRLLREDRDLKKGHWGVSTYASRGVERLRIMEGRGRTIVSSVSMWCSVLCVFVAREETSVSTPLGLR